MGFSELPNHQETYNNSVLLWDWKSSIRRPGEGNELVM